MFSSTVVDPIFAIWSLGQVGSPASFDFSSKSDQPFNLLGGGPSAEFGGSALTSSGSVVNGAEGNGLVQFIGSFDSITFTTPNFENYYAFTVGYDATLTRRRHAGQFPNPQLFRSSASASPRCPSFAARSPVAALNSIQNSQCPIVTHKEWPNDGAFVCLNLQNSPKAASNPATLPSHNCTPNFTATKRNPSWPSDQSSSPSSSRLSPLLRHLSPAGPPPTLKSILLAQLRSTHNKAEWFVPVNTAVAGLTPEQARWIPKSEGPNNPAPEDHSVGMIAYHLALLEHAGAGAAKR